MALLVLLLAGCDWDFAGDEILPRAPSVVTQALTLSNTTTEQVAWWVRGDRAAWGFLTRPGERLPIQLECIEGERLCWSTTPEHLADCASCGRGALTLAAR